MSFVQMQQGRCPSMGIPCQWDDMMETLDRRSEDNILERQKRRHGREDRSGGRHSARDNQRGNGRRHMRHRHDNHFGNGRREGQGVGDGQGGDGGRPGRDAQVGHGGNGHD